MKSSIKIIAAFVFLLNTASAHEYKLFTSNMNFSSEKTLEFDIYLMDVSGGSEELKYAFGQFVFNINPRFANSGTLTSSIIKTDLSESILPLNSSVSDNQLRLSVNRLNPDFDSLPIIPDTEPGLLIARIILKTTAERFSKDDFDLDWSNGENNARTKIVTVVDNEMIEISDFRNHFVKIDSPLTSAGNKTEAQVEYYLEQNYPNPFNPTTVVSYSIIENAFTSVKVYNVTGKVVATLVNENLNAGSYEVEFNGNNFASGIYFYKISSGNTSTMKRMILVQ